MKHVIGTLAVIVGSWAGCANLLGTVDDANNPSDDVALSRCRAEGRAVMHSTGDGDKAFDAYYSCTQDAGLR